jgi:hypothetical protein
MAQPMRSETEERLHICSGGGIGRRARLKIWFRKEWGFDSPSEYKKRRNGIKTFTCNSGNPLHSNVSLASGRTCGLMGNLRVQFVRHYLGLRSRVKNSHVRQIDKTNCCHEKENSRESVGHSCNHFHFVAFL